MDCGPGQEILIAEGIRNVTQLSELYPLAPDRTIISMQLLSIASGALDLLPCPRPRSFGVRSSSSPWSYSSPFVQRPTRCLGHYVTTPNSTTHGSTSSH